MTTMKTLILAGFAVLSFGAGSAMAQNEQPSAQSYFFIAPSKLHASHPAANQIQAGSSDTDMVQFGTSRFNPLGWERSGTLANPG